MSRKTEKKVKLDIFDFEKYPKEYAVFKYFYEGLELSLRFAIFISYKYGHLSEKDRGVLNILISKKTGFPLKSYRNESGKLMGTYIDKMYLDMLTDTFEPYYLMKYWYLHYNPEKYNKRKLLEMLEKYSRYEDVAFNKMYRLYVDPDWQYRSLWFTRSTRKTNKGERQKMTEFYEKLNNNS